MSNYNSSIGLIHSSPDSANLSDVYYVYSDNFLAQQALEQWDEFHTNATIERIVMNISANIAGYTKGIPNLASQWEVLSSTVNDVNGSHDYDIIKIKGALIAITLNNFTLEPLILHTLTLICYNHCIITKREIQHRAIPTTTMQPNCGMGMVLPMEPTRPRKAIRLTRPLFTSTFRSTKEGP